MCVSFLVATNIAWILCKGPISCLIIIGPEFDCDISDEIALYTNTNKQSMGFVSSIGTIFTHKLGFCTCDLL